MPNLSKFFDDPDFHYVIDMLSKYGEPLKDLGTIDLNLSAETIKSVIAGRQETLKVIDNFIADVNVYKNKTINSDNKTTFQ